MDVQTLAAAAGHCERRKANLVAPEYDATSTYEIGAIVMYKGTMYECTTTISTAEAWNADHWTKRTLEYYLSQIGVEYPRFGVSGVGKSTSKLARLWTSAGLSATHTRYRYDSVFFASDAYAPSTAKSA